MPGEGEQNTDPWFTGADAEIQGIIERRGLKDKPALEAFTNMAKAHIEAERLIGAPANEMVRWPKDANDTENWARVRARLGVPADAKEYDFSTVKAPDGTDLDSGFSDTVRGLAHRLNLSKEAAIDLIKGLTEFGSKTLAQENAERTAALAAEQQTLRTSWGQNFDGNRIAARNALDAVMKASGMDAPAVTAALDALEGQIGGARVMELGRAMSKMMREDNYVDTQNPSGNGAMSYQEAKATKEMLLRDQDFITKWNRGDTAALKQLQALDIILVNNKPQSEEDIFRQQVADQYRR